MIEKMIEIAIRKNDKDSIKFAALLLEYKATRDVFLPTEKKEEGVCNILV